MLLNECMRTNSIPKIWRKSRVVALLKPCKDPASPKSYGPISLLCHTYKLFERLILNRVAPFVDEHLIPEQAGFRPGKSCTGQLLNLTQLIEDGYEEGLITGAAFVDLSAAYDTVNHRILTRKLFEITQDVRLTELIQNMLSNRRFFVDLVGKRSRWRRQKNGLPQGSVLAPLLFNIIIYKWSACPSQHKEFPVRWWSVHCHTEAILWGGGKDSWWCTRRLDSILRCQPPQG